MAIFYYDFVHKQRKISGNPDAHCCCEAVAHNIFKSVLLLQPLRWRCVDCVIHHERDVREEQQSIYVARTSNNRVTSSEDLYCCLLPQCEALRTFRSGFSDFRSWSLNELFDIFHGLYAHTLERDVAVSLNLYSDCCMIWVKSFRPITQTATCPLPRYQSKHIAENSQWVS